MTSVIENLNSEELLETDKELLETDKELLETDKELLETYKELLETDKELLETDKELLETDKELLETDNENNKLKWIDYSMTDIVKSTYTYLSETYQNFNFEEYLSLDNKKHIITLKSNLRTMSSEKLIEFLIYLKKYIVEIYLSTQLTVNDKTEIIKNTANNFLDSDNLKHSKTYLKENTNYLINKINETISSIKESLILNI